LILINFNAQTFFESVSIDIPLVYKILLHAPRDANYARELTTGDETLHVSPVWFIRMLSDIFTSSTILVVVVIQCNSLISLLPRASRLHCEHRILASFVANATIYSRFCFFNPSKFCVYIKFEDIVCWNYLILSTSSWDLYNNVIVKILKKELVSMNYWY